MVSALCITYGLYFTLEKCQYKLPKNKISTIQVTDVTNMVDFTFTSNAKSIKVN